MADTVKNLGRNTRQALYVNDVRLGRDFRNIKNFKRNFDFYEGMDEYLGRGDVEPWQVFKTGTFSFTIEEDNAGQVDTVMNAIHVSEKNGTKPNIRVVEETENNDGTTTAMIYTKITMKAGRDTPAKGDKVTRDFTGVFGAVEPRA